MSFPTHAYHASGSANDTGMKACTYVKRSGISGLMLINFVFLIRLYWPYICPTK